MTAATNISLQIILRKSEEAVCCIRLKKAECESLVNWHGINMAAQNITAETGHGHTCLFMTKIYALMWIHTEYISITYTAKNKKNYTSFLGLETLFRCIVNSIRKIKICMFVTMVYQYNSHYYRHYTSSWPLFKNSIQLNNFVFTSEETRYVSATTPTG
jgi:hypothetical protein